MHDLSLNNLHDLSVFISTGVLTLVTDVAGSGKSTLVNRLLPLPHPRAILVDQKGLGGARRSSVASYVGELDEICSGFAKAATQLVCSVITPKVLVQSAGGWGQSKPIWL